MSGSLNEIIKRELKHINLFYVFKIKPKNILKLWITILNMWIQNVAQNLLGLNNYKIFHRFYDNYVNTIYERNLQSNNFLPILRIHMDLMVLLKNRIKYN